VELKLEAGEIDVHLRHQEMLEWPCPECGAACKLYDHEPDRQWRHLDTCQYQTIFACGTGRAVNATSAA
jgi:transposase